MGDIMEEQGHPAFGAAWWDGSGRLQPWISLGCNGSIDCMALAHDGTLVFGGGSRAALDDQ